MEEILNLLLGPLGLTIALILILVAGKRGIWVWGSELQKCEKEKNFWREAALRGTELAEKAVTLSERNER